MEATIEDILVNLQREYNELMEKIELQKAYNAGARPETFNPDAPILKESVDMRALHFKKEAALCELAKVIDRQICLYQWKDANDKHQSPQRIEK